jgi:transcription termination factor Rho
MRSGEQLRMVELAFGRASRRAEAGADVVLIVDSLSRLAVAADDPGRVKPIFAAGRETEEEGTGSLTVIATALTDDGDEGEIDRAIDTTESSLIVLDRDLAAAGVYPAIDAAAGRLTGEEHLRSEEELAAIRSLRSELAGLPAAEGAALVRERVSSDG